MCGGGGKCTSWAFRATVAMLNATAAANNETVPPGCDGGRLTSRSDCCPPPDQLSDCPGRYGCIASHPPMKSRAIYVAIIPIPNNESMPIVFGTWDAAAATDKFYFMDVRRECSRFMVFPPL